MILLPKKGDLIQAQNGTIILVLSNPIPINSVNANTYDMLIYNMSYNAIRTARFFRENSYVLLSECP